MMRLLANRAPLTLKNVSRTAMQDKKLNKIVLVLLGCLISNFAVAGLDEIYQQQQRKKAAAQQVAAKHAAQKKKLDEARTKQKQKQKAEVVRQKKLSRQRQMEQERIVREQVASERQAKQASEDKARKEANLERIIREQAIYGHAIVEMGEINARSILGQPFKAAIEIIATEIPQDLVARLASPEAYKSADLDYPSGLTFRFEIDEKGKRIVVSSAEAVRDNSPFVSLLIELTWSSYKTIKGCNFLIYPAGYNKADLP